MNLHAMGAQAAVVLADELSDDAAEFWHVANKDITWGWKRDVGSQNRMVFFSGRLDRRGDHVVLDRFYFHYRSKLIAGTGAGLRADLERAVQQFTDRGDAAVLNCSSGKGHEVFELRIGSPIEIDRDRTARLKLRRARNSIAKPDSPDPLNKVLVEDVLPADLYVGSGLSYEAGLPTLCDMHDVFAVDCHDDGGFMVGAKDWLPGALADEGAVRLTKFCAVHTQALAARPTEAMEAIARHVTAGRVGKVFTDNVDNLLAKTAVPFERVRGSGVFNERYEAQFASPNLIVIGVAADRRQIIRQARAKGLNVIVVNPCKKVSPNVTHLEYVRPGDRFFKWEAQTFFRKLGL
jgi:hypothetical protein